jgi:hypothetical protein
MADYFVCDHFKLPNGCKGQQRDAPEERIGGVDPDTITQQHLPSAGSAAGPAGHAPGRRQRGQVDVKDS